MNCPDCNAFAVDPKTGVCGDCGALRFTDRTFMRLTLLSAKMEKMAAIAGRRWSTDRDLSDKERAEWQHLNAITEAECEREDERHRRRDASAGLSGCLPLFDQPSDGAW